MSSVDQPVWSGKATFTWFRATLVRPTHLPIASVWKSIVLPRIKHFIRLSLYERIPCFAFLHQRGVLLTNGPICSFCQSDQESTAHCLLLCTWPRQLWTKIFNKLHIQWVMRISVSSFILNWNNLFAGHHYEMLWSAFGLHLL